MILDVMCIHILPFLAVSVLNTPKTDNESENTRPNRHHVGTPVANQTFITLPLSSWEDFAMRIIHKSIEEVEDIARHNRGECHAPPILAEAMNTESFGDKGRENAEQEAISKACQSRHKLKIVRVFNANCTKLRSRKD